MKGTPEGVKVKKMSKWISKNMFYEENIESRELELFTDNTRELYDMTIYYIGTLKKHLKRNEWDSIKALKGFYNIAAEASRRYKEEFGYSFTTQARYTVAVNLFEFWVVEDEDNNFESLHKERERAEIINFKREIKKEMKEAA